MTLEYLQDNYYPSLPSRRHLVDPTASLNCTDPDVCSQDGTEKRLLLWIFLFCFVTAFVRVSCYVAVSRGSGRRLVMVVSSWRQRRKEYIEHRLITKKVVRRSDTTEASSERNHHEDPHEINGNNNSSISINTCRRQKSNLLLDDDDTSSRTCPICLGEYKDDEQICWSQNPHCSHAFHRSCADPWLLKHDACPCCRANYLITNDDDDDDDDRRSPLRADEPISLSDYLRASDSMIPTSGGSFDDSGYNSDISDVWVDSSSSSSSSSVDATGQATEDIESQASSSSSEGSASIEFILERHEDENARTDPSLSPPPTTTTCTGPSTTSRRHLSNETITTSVTDMLNILNEMRGSKSDDNIRYSLVCGIES